MLNVQYRMHPAISLFPCKEFYDEQISDAPVVKDASYQKRFLEGEIYASYSFINIAKGKEKSGRGHSLKNMVEVAVISEMIKNLNKGCFSFSFVLNVIDKKSSSLICILISCVTFIFEFGRVYEDTEES